MIKRVDWESAQSFLPLHDVVRFEFSGQDSVSEEAKHDDLERHLASIYQLGSQVASPTPRFPSLMIYIDQTHFDAVMQEYFDSDHLPLVKPSTYLRGTPHGRGLYDLAASLWYMIEDRTDILSRYCLEIALIKAIALAPPNMMAVVQRGRAWGPMMHRVEHAAYYMIQHIEEPFDLQALAKAVSCSTRALNEAFQVYLNLGPMKFHRQCRLEAAYAALTKGRTSVTEVATQYGFENMGRFAKAFEEQFGCKPSTILKR
ncbi:MAG: helix-turn-helix transcriptional regulator [Akkermansiaceae bacterium]|nr:helix-turn-helix transcriptional regulator [Akkermansiaceae bacterium]